MRQNLAEPTLISLRTLRSYRRTLKVLFFLLANLLAYLATRLIYLRLPKDFKPTTDILGHPVVWNFNIDLFFHDYYLKILFLPIAALILYRVLVWISGLSEEDDALNQTTVIQADLPGPTELRQNVTSLAKIFLTGFIFCLGSTLQPWYREQALFLPFLGLATVFTLAISLLAVFLRKSMFPNRSFRDISSAVHLAVLPLTVFSLYFLSQSAHLVEAQTKIVRFPWIPLPLVLTISGLAYAWIFWAGKRARFSNLRKIETDLVTFFSVPVVIYILNVAIQGDLGNADLFHEGENLASGLLLQKGLFPWRDLIFIHGLLEDPFNSLLGHVLFDTSRWGARMGHSLIFTPLYFVLNYMLFAYLFRKNVLFLFLTAFLAAPALPGLFAHVHFRFILHPLILIAFGGMLRFRNPLSSFVFSLLLFVELIITPESTYAVPAFGAILLIYESGFLEPKQHLLARFRATVWTATWGLLFTGAWFAFLAGNHSLGDFIHYYTNFSSGHRYTGGIPVQGRDPLFRFAVFAPIILMMTAFWWLTLNWKDRAKLPVQDWVMLSLSVFLLFYYQKYLSRADGHVFHVWAVTIPLFLYFAQALVSRLDHFSVKLPGMPFFQRSVTRHPMTLALIAYLMIYGEQSSPKHLISRINTLKYRYYGTVQERSDRKHIGYGRFDNTTDALMKDVENLLNAYLEPSDRIFDFSNEPALYFYFLDRLPATKYFHVTMAHHDSTQNQLIEQLEREKPKIIPFFSRMSMLGAGWDQVPNMVRHQWVSQYILENYEPLVYFTEHLFLIRKDLKAPGLAEKGVKLTAPVLKGKHPYLEMMSCNWGYAPYFFRTSLTSASTPVTSTSEASAEIQMKSSKWKDTYVKELAIPLDSVGKYRFMEIEFEQLSKDDFVLTNDLERLPKTDAGAIRFSSFEDSSVRYRIHLGSCAQWYAWNQSKLYLQHLSPAKIQRVRLVM